MANIRSFTSSPDAFFAAVVVPTPDGPTRLGNIAAEHQREWIAALAPAMLALSRGERPTIGKFWIEASKGAGKDFILALAVLWLCAFSRRPLTIQVGAADSDQADELRKSAKAVLRLNPWLASRVVVQTTRIVCEATECEAAILTSDVAGSHGARPDLLILNELHAITRWEFAENLLDNSSKVPNGVVVIATNAGFTGSDAFRWREMARQSARWSFHQFARPAPWLDAREIEEARLRNSNERYRRLFWGEWASGNGDAIDPADIQAAIRARGPLTGREPDIGQWSFVAGLDLGVKHDHSALVVLGVKDGATRIRLAHVMSWRPPRGGQVDLSAVEKHILDLHRSRLHLARLYYDPSQAIHLCQRLRRLGMNVEELPFTPKNLDQMATSLIEVFRSQLIDLFDNPQLVRDLGRLTIEEKSYGQRLTAVSDADGHADTATALAIALPAAQRMTFARPLDGSRHQKAFGGMRILADARRFNLLARGQFKGGRRVFHPPGW